jgi:hypothetical protein
MKLWLDDKRDPVEFTGETDWIWIKTAQDAVDMILFDHVEVVSLDHDLGPEEVCGNGYMVAKAIEEAAFNGYIKPIEWRIHSQNSVGVASMRQALENADRFWNRT